MNTPRRPGLLAPHSTTPEPFLTFDPDDTSAVDRHPLRGLLNFGPHSSRALPQYVDPVRIAIVGPTSGMHGRRSVLRSLSASHRPNDRADYVPEFPGFQRLFGIELRPADRAAQIEVPERLDLSDGRSPTNEVRSQISRFMERLESVRSIFDVAIIHLPDSWEPGLRGIGFDAHDEVKALGARLGIPTQVINDRTFTFRYEASRAWRLSIALYVKAGGVPWRLAPLPGVPDDTAYIGLAYAFRGDPGEEAHFVTCCSQVFDSDGGGMQFVAYDARDPIADEPEVRRNPYLSRADMRAVMARSLGLYQRRNGGRIPTRIVVHKTTPFRHDEVLGVRDALAAVSEIECIEVSQRTPWRGVRLQGHKQPDGYPVHRGTVQQLSDRAALVWVAGNAPTVAKGAGGSFYQGAKSIPRPIVLTRHCGRGALELPALEALALTKMDWNNDALYDPIPVTIGYSQVLARTIANVPDLPRREYAYRMFM